MERQGLAGKKINVYFDDGCRVTRKDGVVSSEDAYSISLNNKEIIPRSRIVRIEICGES